MTSPDPLITARAQVLRDLEATDVASAECVSILEEAVSQRRWWLEQWAEGSPFVTGLVAQDVQDALLSTSGRWPLCHHCDVETPHALYVDPDIGGPDPQWVCEESGTVVAAVGRLS
ncbi:hypothetical protein [Marmoricola endophyticus]|uniref:hypothetical protein n=1 Tax=Marmoricola endophyticus TaxID=2040280 RepID=UPI001665E6EA|nr:hypothetical protein [Marmoricola endophyticus]